MPTKIDADMLAYIRSTIPPLRAGDIFSVLAALENATARITELEAQLAEQEPA